MNEKASIPIKTVFCMMAFLAFLQNAQGAATSSAGSGEGFPPIDGLKLLPAVPAAGGDVPFECGGAATTWTKRMKGKLLGAAEKLPSALIKAGYLNEPEDARDGIEKVFRCNAALGKYFNAKERAAVVEKGIAAIRKNFDALSVVEIGRTITRVVGQFIVEKVMQTQGVTSALRRGMWERKLLADFEMCSKGAKNYAEVDRCQSRFAATLPRNLGLAITFEISREKLGSLAMGTSQDSSKEREFLQKRADQFSACIAKMSDRFIDDCGLESVRSGLLQVAIERARVQMKPQFKSKERLTQEVLRLQGTMRQCLKKASQVDDFMGCVDQLVLGASKSAIAERIRSEKMVKKGFPDSKSRAKLVRDAEQHFSSCFSELVRNKKRDESGLLVIDPCVERVTLRLTNQVTYAVAAIELEDAVKAQFRDFPVKDGAGVAQSVTKQAQAALDSCWSMDQEPKQKDACLKIMIRRLAGAVGSVKLDQKLDKEYLKEKPDAKERFLHLLDQCVARRLPATIGEDSELAEDVAPCGDEVMVTAAKEIAALRLPREIVKNLPAGQNADDPKVKEATDSVMKHIGGCLEGKGASTGEVLAARVDRCFKTSIREIGIFAAGLELSKKIGPLYLDSPERGASVRGVLLGWFEKCADAKKDQAELDKYPDEIKVCGEKLRNQAILLLAKDQLSIILDSMNRSGRGKNTGEVGGGCSDCVSEPRGGLIRAENQARGMMGDMAKVVDAFIAYDLQQAKADLLKIISKLEDEIRSGADSKESLEKLMNWLVTDTRVIDQLVKATIRDSILDGLDKQKTDPKNKIPEKILDSWKVELITKENLDAILDSAQGKVLKVKMIEVIGKPLLTEGADMSSPRMMKAKKALEDEYRDLLADSREFGGQIIRDMVNQGIRQKGVVVRVLAWVGDRKWERYADTPAGREVEQFIKREILAPLLKGTLNDVDRAARMAEAEAWVKKVMTKSPSS